MSRYIVYRLLLAIPTIGLVLVLAFLLMQSVPGDVILRQLTLDGDNLYVSQSKLHTSYKNKAEKSGALLPDFYFTIQPNYFPSNINQFYPVSKRDQAKKLIRETQNWTTVEDVFSELNSAISKLEKDKNYNSLLSEILKLEQSQSVDELKYRAKKLTATSNLDSIGHAVSLPLQEAISQLIITKKLSYPKISWNGSSNKFHFWIARGLSSTQNTSLVDAKPVWPKIFDALKWTFSLSIISLILIGIFSLLLAYSQVFWRGTIWDHLLANGMYVLYAIPLFWLCTMMVVFFTTSEYGTWTNLFPSVGIRPSFSNQSFITQLTTQFGQLLLPIFCIVIHAMAYMTRQTRKDMLSSLKSPFVLAARAKGLSEHQVLRKHILPDALLPYSTLLTGAIPSLFTGSLIVEVIFNIPGVGRLMLDSVQNADWPVTMNILIIISIATILGFLLGDIILMKLYPKSAESLITQS